jgi:hypothetical protein
LFVCLHWYHYQENDYHWIIDIWIYIWILHMIIISRKWKEKHQWYKSMLGVYKKKRWKLAKVASWFSPCRLVRVPCMKLGLQVLNRLKISPLKIGPYNLICIVGFSCSFSFFLSISFLDFFVLPCRFLQLVVPFLLDVHVCILAHPLVQGCQSSFYLMLLFVLFLNVVACPPACQPIECCCSFSFALVLLVLLWCYSC